MQRAAARAAARRRREAGEEAESGGGATKEENWEGVESMEEGVREDGDFSELDQFSSADITSTLQNLG